MRYLLMCRSLTYAQRGARVLERAGITGTVSRAPRSASAHGCSYCIIVSAYNKTRAVSILSAAGLVPERVYERDEDDVLREVSV